MDIAPELCHANDGVKKDGKEPAVIAICGIGPITLHPVEAGSPGVRKL